MENYMGFRPPYSDMDDGLYDEDGNPTEYMKDLLSIYRGDKPESHEKEKEKEKPNRS